MLTKLKAMWEYIQDLMDVSGDTIMCVMSSVFIMRVAMSMLGKPPITSAEAAMYASAIATFGYSNRGTH